MEMCLTLTMPETTDLNPTDVQIFTAAKLYEAQKLSLGQAAHAAGLSKRTFAELLAGTECRCFLKMRKNWNLISEMPGSYYDEPHRRE